MKTIIEPFKIKSVERIKFTSIKEREAILKKAYYNPFMIPAEDVLIDLLTDSGTSAMSSRQWAGRNRAGGQCHPALGRVGRRCRRAGCTGARGAGF